MKVVHAVVPTEEPVTIAAKESVTQQELRLSVVRKEGQRKIDLRIWDIDSTGGAIPHNGGFTLSMHEAELLTAAIEAALGRKD